MRLYPVTIIATRYGGAYERGAWAAFNLDPEDVPEDVTGSDPECMEWWHAPTVPVGVGSTPDEALAALGVEMAKPRPGPVPPSCPAHPWAPAGHRRIPLCVGCAGDGDAVEATVRHDSGDYLCWDCYAGGAGTFVKIDPANFPACVGMVP